ncbi:IS5 family transposase [Xanthobacter agilis]|uniref:IS5 family transposase n=1 Tax=Xanthobacter agilis TaxID=47492 RepID=UPI001F012C40|nr:IS5 family transposase [Xanthobacter agilis]
MSRLFWLNEEQWAKIEPLLPHYGSPPRVDDRRILSGIIHVLRCGCRWCDCPSDYGPYTTVYNRFNRWSRKGIWQRIYAAITGDERTPRQLLADSTHVKAHRSAAGAKRGEQRQAIGRSRGGRTTKIHALSDGKGRPLVLVLTPGQAADIKMLPVMLDAAPPARELLADTAYDSDKVRDDLAGRDMRAVIPNNPTRKYLHPFDRKRYKKRNAIERMFCRLKDFRRIATRYDKLARNYLASLCLAALVSCWIR